MPLTLMLSTPMPAPGGTTQPAMVVLSTTTDPTRIVITVSSGSNPGVSTTWTKAEASALMNWLLDVTYPAK